MSFLEFLLGFGMFFLSAYLVIIFFVLSVALLVCVVLVLTAAIKSIIYRDKTFMEHFRNEMEE